MFPKVCFKVLLRLLRAILRHDAQEPARSPLALKAYGRLLVSMKTDLGGVLSSYLELLDLQLVHHRLDSEYVGFPMFTLCYTWSIVDGSMQLASLIYEL